MTPPYDHDDALLAELGLDLADPAAALRDAARDCRARNYNEEGIPMLLVLERVDGREPAVGPDVAVGDGRGAATAGGDGTTLARAFEMTLTALDVADEPSHRGIAFALQVVAARWFTLGVPERP